MKQHKTSLIKWFWTMYVWFHLQVYLLRKMATNRIGTKNRRFYICSLSCDVIVYKVKLPDMQLIVSHFVQIELRRSCSMFLGNVETSATPRILPWFTVGGLLVSTKLTIVTSKLAHCLVVSSVKGWRTVHHSVQFSGTPVRLKMPLTQ